MLPSSGPIKWEELTWKDIETLVQKEGVKTVLWSCGATEQHGFHLPLATDAICSYSVACRVSELTGVPVLPPITIGASESHGKFPGTLYIRPQTLGLIVQDVVEGLYKWGIRQLLLINGHMWNVGGLIAARDNIRSKYPDFLVKSIQYWDYGDTGLFDDCPEAPGFVHAEFGETSLVLASRPELVEMDKALNVEDRWLFWDYRMDQVSLSGVLGRATTEATEEKGKEILEQICQDIAAQLKKGMEEEPPVKEWYSTDPPSQ
jgi:creatinine amidohydrolase